MAEKMQSNQSKVLMVAGRNDLHVVEHIRSKVLHHVNFDVRDMQNMDRLI